MIESDVRQFDNIKKKRNYDVDSGLNIDPTGTLEFMSLCALNQRVDSRISPFRKVTQWHVYPSGGEYYVAASLEDCFRLQTGIVAAMVDYPIGNLIADRERAIGIIPFYKHFNHNVVNVLNKATIYNNHGYGVRAPVVFYDRAKEASAQLK
jgi:2-dehydro-3-deoxygluconokinase